MYTFLLVDADAKSREKLSQQIQKVEAHCNILEASSTEEALRCFITQKPNLIFLDADLPGKSGFDFIHELTQVGEQPRVVMVAQHQRYAIQAIRASVVDYLLKPVEETDIRICLKRLYALEEEELERENMTELLIRLKQNHRLRVNSRVGFEIIKPEEILYCEADGNYTRICMLDNRKLTTSQRIVFSN
jgi:two-component system LytT family response regulator